MDKSTEELNILLLWILYHLIPKTEKIFYDFLNAVNWNKGGIKDIVFNGLWPKDYIEAKEGLYIDDLVSNSFGCRKIDIIDSFYNLQEKLIFHKEVLDKLEIDSNTSESEGDQLFKDDFQLFITIALLNFELTINPSKELIDQYLSVFNKFVKSYLSTGPIISLSNFVLGPFGIIRSNSVKEINNEKQFHDTLASDIYTLTQSITGWVQNSEVYGYEDTNWSVEQKKLHAILFDNIEFYREWWIASSKFSPHELSPYMGNIYKFLNDFLSEEDLKKVIKFLHLTNGKVLGQLKENKNIKNEISDILGMFRNDNFSLSKYKLLQLIFVYDPAEIINSINNFIIKNHKRYKFAADYPYNIAVTKYGIIIFIPKAVSQNHVNYLQPVKDISFAERTALALIEAYEKIDIKNLELLLKNSPGATLLDRVLHYVIAKTPTELIKSIVVANPIIAECLIDSLYLKYAFKDIDMTVNSEYQELINAITTLLGKKYPKHIFSINKYLSYSEQYLKLNDRELLKDAISNLGRTIESMLHNIVVYLFLINNNGKDKNEIIKANPGKISLDIANLFNQLNIINEHKEMLQIPPKDWVLNSLKMILTNFNKLINTSEEFVDKSKVQSLAKEYSKNKINVLRNIGAHYKLPDDAPSINELKYSIDELRAFIKFIEDLQIYPQLFHLKSITKLNELPFQVVFTDANGNDSKTYYFSNYIDFQEGEVYAVKDFTNNTISINPMVIEWYDL